MKNLYKISILALLFFANYSLAMENDPSKINTQQELLSEENNAHAPMLVDQCSKTIADRLAKDLLAQRDYTDWLDLEKLPEELQYNILKAFCRYHSHIAWKYLADSISVKSLPDNIGDKCHNYHVKLSSNRKFIKAFTDLGYKKIWNLSTNKCLFNDEKITAADFSYDSKYIAIVFHRENNIKIWDTTLEQFLPISFEYQDQKVTEITISANNKLIAAAFQDGTIKLFDMETGICLNSIETPDSISNDFKIIKSIFITADQKFLITVSRTKTIRIWNLNTNECVKTIDDLYIQSFSFNSDAKFISIAIGGICKGKLILIDATTGDIQLEINENCPITSVYASLNKKTIAFGFADGNAKILNRETNECLSLLRYNIADIESIALSTDNKIVITASLDNTIKLWNAKTGQCINTFEGDSPETLQELGSQYGPFALNVSGILSVVISPDNALIAAGLNDGVVKIWQIDLSKGLKAILEVIKKNINQEKQNSTK